MQDTPARQLDGGARRWRAPVRRSAPSLGLLDLTVVYPQFGVVVICIAGEVDMLTAPQLEGAALAQLLEPAPAKMVLDLGDVTFLGVSGLAAMVNVLEAGRRIGTWLRLARPAPAVRRLLELTGLADRFDVLPPSCMNRDSAR